MPHIEELDCAAEVRRRVSLPGAPAGWRRCTAYGRHELAAREVAPTGELGPCRVVRVCGIHRLAYAQGQTVRIITGPRGENGRFASVLTAYRAPAAMDRAEIEEELACLASTHTLFEEDGREDYDFTDVERTRWNVLCAELSAMEPSHAG